MAWESELWRKKCRWIIHITWEIDTLVLTLCLLYWHPCCVDTLVVLTLCLYCDALFDDLSFWMLAEKTEMHNADHLGNELWNTCKTYTSAQWASSSDALFVLTWVSEWWHSLMTWDSLWRLFWWLKKCRWIMHITWEKNSETLAKRTPLQNTLFLYWRPKKTRKTKRKESVC